MSSTKVNRNDPCTCGSGKKYKNCCQAAVEAREFKFAPDNKDVKNAQNALDAAVAHHQAGRIAQAEDIYRQLLRVRPDHPDALHLLGVIAYGKGERQQAIELIGKAIAVQPSAVMYGNMALAVRDLGDKEKAIELLRQALQLAPTNPNLHNSLGAILKSQGKLAEAMNCFLEAISHQRDYVEAFCNLGEAAYDMGHTDEAIRCCRVALTLKPDDVATHITMGNALKEKGEADAARQHFEHVLTLNPNNVAAYVNLGNIAREQGRLELAIDLFRKGLSLDSSMHHVYSNLLFASLIFPSYSQEEIFAEHLQFATLYETPLKPFWPVHDNPRDKHKRLKIGYVSGDFRNHSVANFFEPILARHDKAQVEVFCYYNHHQHDNITRRFAALANHWIICKGWSDDALAERIRQDGIDILVDLSGHTAHHRLLTFARKPAPVQITWIGYPATTGLSAMDYRLTDANLDPPGMTERYHSETLLRLPVSAQFIPEATRPSINALPALNQDVFTFACLNNLAKVTEETIALWARILTALPRSRIMLGHVQDEPSRQKLVEMFATHGISEERLVMHPKLPMSDFLTLHHQIDLALDPFPYNGGTTSFHALSMGVPVITLAGSSPVSRCGVAVMESVGLPEFIAFSKEEYVQRAIEFAGNLHRLDEIRQSLSLRFTSPTHSGQTDLAFPLEQLFRQVWEKWCDISTH